MLSLILFFPCPDSLSSIHLGYQPKAGSSITSSNSVMVACHCLLTLMLQGGLVSVKAHITVPYPLKKGTVVNNLIERDEKMMVMVMVIYTLFCWWYSLPHPCMNNTTLSMHCRHLFSSFWISNLQCYTSDNNVLTKAGPPTKLSTCKWILGMIPHICREVSSS